MKAYKLTTTFFGADARTALYFSTEDAARNYLATLENGEVNAVQIDGIDALPSEGCTYNDIDYLGGIEK